MNSYFIVLKPEVAEFYERVALASGRPIQQVLSDALFKLAGELPLEAMEKAKRKRL